MGACARVGACGGGWAGNASDPTAGKAGRLGQGCGWTLRSHGGGTHAEMGAIVYRDPHSRRRCVCYGGSWNRKEQYVMGALARSLDSVIGPDLLERRVGGWVGGVRYACWRGALLKRRDTL